MTFHPQPEVMQPFLVSSDTYFFYHPFTYSNSLEASCFLAKWLLVHKKQLMLIYVVCWGHTHLLIDIKTFFPLIEFAGNFLYPTQLNSASSF
jgi:hypothetical protein